MIPILLWLFIKRQTSDKSSGATNDNKWYNQWQTNEWPFRLILLFFERERSLPLNTVKRTLYTLKTTLKRDYWIKSRNRLLRRNINSKKRRNWDSLIHIILKICEDNMTQTQPNDSALVGSGHPELSVPDSPWILIRLREHLWENNFN